MTTVEQDFIGKRIKALVEENKVSQRELSLKLGHGETYINQIVHGRSFPSVDELFYICEQLHITPAQFFTETSSPKQLRFLNELDGLTEDDLQHLLDTVRYMKKKNIKYNKVK